MVARLRAWLAALARPRGDPAPDGGQASGEQEHGATLGARGSAWMAVGALLVGLIAVPFGGDVGRDGFGRLVDGAVEVDDGDGWRALEVPATVPAGAELRVGNRAARIEVEDGLLTLAEGTRLQADPQTAHLRQGSVLVEAEEPMRVRTGATTAEGRGAWRLDVGVASRVATYGGRLHVADDQAERTLGRYRQVAIRDGALESELRPLRYREADPWDQWLLADALAVDRLAARLQASLERSYGSDPRQEAFYAAFVVVDDAGLAPALGDLAVVTDGDAFGPPADILMAVAAIDALRADAALDVEVATERVVGLRRAGATWGLVLIEHDLAAASLRAAMERALEQVEVTPPPEPPADDTGATDATDEPAPEPAPTGPDEPEPAPDPPSEPAPDDGEDGDGDGSVTDPVEDAVRDTGDSLDDLVDDTGDSVGDAVEDTTDSVGDLLEDSSDSVADTVDDVGSLLGD